MAAARFPLRQQPAPTTHPLEDPMTDTAAEEAESASASPDLRQRCADALIDHLSRTADIRPHSGDSGELAFMPEVTNSELTRIADAVMAVRDTELEQARAERDRYRLARDSARRRAECLLGTLDGTQSNLERAEAALDRERKQHLARADAINRVIALHQPRNHNGRTICGACSDYDPSSDSSDSSAPVPYPCPTIRALDSTAQPAEEDA